MSNEKEKSQENENSGQKPQPSAIRSVFASMLFLAAIVAAPIVGFKLFESWQNQDDSSATAGSTDDLHAGMPTSKPGLRPTMQEAINFNVTPNWLLQHWPRIVESGSDLRVLTYRVPLVTGIETHDLAGSITYDFDQRQQLLRIKFVGSTGDVSQLIQFVRQQFGLVPRQTNDPNLFVFEAAAPAGGNRQLMHVKYARVQRSGDLHRRYDVTLQLFRPTKS